MLGVADQVFPGHMAHGGLPERGATNTYAARGDASIAGIVLWHHRLRGAAYLPGAFSQAVACRQLAAIHYGHTSRATRLESFFADRDQSVRIIAEFADGMMEQTVN